MIIKNKKVFNIKNKSEMEKFAVNMAKKAKEGDVILLNGTLGVGKTFFVKAFIKYLTKQNIDIVSPTFNLLKIYNTSNFDIYHFDLYRLRNIEELYDIGFDDIIGSGVSLIEWPEMAYDLINVPYTELNIKITGYEEEREIEVSKH